MVQLLQVCFGRAEVGNEFGVGGGVVWWAVGGGGLCFEGVGVGGGGLRGYGGVLGVQELGWVWYVCSFGGHG